MAGAGWSNQEKRDGNLGRKILSIGKLASLNSRIQSWTP